MEIVINNCFGGFSLSDKAERLYAKKAEFKIFRYHQTKHKFRDGVNLYEKCADNSDSFMTVVFKKDQGESFDVFPEDGGYWYSREIERTDKILIEVVKELGEKANGSCANLTIVEIPDGTSWEISEYDGSEHIAETHKTWY